MKKYLIAQLQKVFAFFLLFAFLNATFKDGTVSQTITRKGSEPLVSLLSSDKSFYLEKEDAGSGIDKSIDSQVAENESLALNSKGITRARMGNEKHRLVLPVVKLTTAHPEY